MAEALLESVDGRLMVAVPDQLREEMELVEGNPIELRRDKEGLTVAKPKKYPLEQLLEEHKQIAHLLEEDRAWLDAPRVGRELI